MKRFLTGFWLLIGALSLVACSGPKTVEEVTGAFWQAVVSGDTRQAMHFSTLADIQDTKAFARDWQGMTVTVEKSAIEGDHAFVKTLLSGGRYDTLGFITHLRRLDGKWRVDDKKTGASLNEAAGVERLLGQLSQLGRDISAQLEGASSSLAASLQDITGQLGALADRLNAQMQKDITRYSERLSTNLEEMAKSIQQALREWEDRLSNQDRRTLKQTVDALETSSKALAEPSLEAIGHAGRTALETHQRLASVEEPSLRHYQQQWQAWLQRIEVDMHKALHELSTDN